MVFGGASWNRSQAFSFDIFLPRAALLDSCLLLQCLFRKVLVFGAGRNTGGGRLVGVRAIIDFHNLLLLFSNNWVAILIELYLFFFVVFWGFLMQKLFLILTFFQAQHLNRFSASPAISFVIQSSQWFFEGGDLALHLDKDVRPFIRTLISSHELS